jgi:hypothetical protein
MRVGLNFLLFLLFSLAACPGSTAHAGEKETHWATIRLPVHWISRSGRDSGKCPRQFIENRSLLYQLERNGDGHEKSKIRALWHL